MPGPWKKFKDLRYQIFYGLVLKRGRELKRLGDPKGICQWTICPDALNRASVVYSGGLGSDITFEHDLVEHFGCDLVLYDPSPAGLKTMSLPENKLPQFHYFPLALTGHSGKVTLAPPPDGVGDSWFEAGAGEGGQEFPCIDLPGLMERNGHGHVDLLKLDIEGSEYEVIEELLERKIPVRQICVEFHHAILPGIPRSRTIGAILKLLTHGYQLLNQSGNDHTFVRKRWAL